jgi:hypothetical protein
MTSKRKRGRPVGETLGGIIVGFDQQVFRTLPPAHELVQKSVPVRGLSGEDGTELTIVLTTRDDEAGDDEPHAEDESRDGSTAPDPGTDADLD